MAKMRILILIYLNLVLSLSKVTPHGKDIKNMNIKLPFYQQMAEPNKMRLNMFICSNILLFRIIYF